MTTPAWLKDDDVTRSLPELAQPRPTPDPALALAPVLPTDCPVCLESEEFCPGTCGPELLAESGFYGALGVYIGRRAAA